MPNILTENDIFLNIFLENLSPMNIFKVQTGKAALQSQLLGTLTKKAVQN